MSIKKTLLIFVAVFSFVPAVYAKDDASTPDVVFLDQFSEHHADAIKMSEMAISKADNPQIKQMAKKMVTDQKKEIAQMKKWRKEIAPSAPKAKLEMPKIDMSGLREKSGREFDIAFLDMMSKHHSQGVEMAKSASGKLSNPQIKTFADTAAENQDQERKHLEEMKKTE